MKKYKLNTLLVGAFATVGFLTACNNEPLTYENGSGITEADVYFSSEAQTEFELNGTGGSFDVTINRGPKGPALTVPISVLTLTDGYEPTSFTFPATVKFEEGATSANFTVEYTSFKESGLDFDEYVDFLLTIEEEYRSDFGDSELEISVYYPSTWTSLGTGSYYDLAWYVGPGEEDYVTNVEFLQNDADPNLFRVSNPYIVWTGQKSYLEFRVLQEGDIYLGQEITEPDLVAFNDFEIDYDTDTDEPVYIIFPGRFGLPVSQWVYNYVDEYQDNGLPAVAVLSPVYYEFESGTMWNFSDKECIIIAFPGVDLGMASVKPKAKSLVKKAPMFGDMVNVPALTKLGKGK